MLRRIALISSIVLLGVLITGCSDTNPKDDVPELKLKSIIDIVDPVITNTSSLSYRATENLNGIQMARLDFNKTVKGILLSKDNKTALVTTGSGGLNIVDINEPTQPTLIKTIAGDAYGMVLSSDGTLLVSTSGFSGISIFEGENVRELNITKVFDLAGWAYCAVFSQDEKVIYVGTNKGINIIDITIPGQPVLLDEHNTTSPAFDIKLSSDGSKAYVANDDEGLLVFDLQDPTKLVYLNAITTITSHKVTLNKEETRAYVTGGFKKIHIIDISEPLSLLHTYKVSNTPSHITLSQNEEQMYVGVSSIIEVVDISTDIPTFIRHMDAFGGPGQIRSNGKQLFVAVYNSLSVYDPSDVENPMILDRVSINPNVQQLRLDHNGSTLYISDGGNLTIVDVNDTENISLESSTDINGKSKIGKITLSQNDNLAFIPNYTSGLKIYDVKDHQNIKFVGSIDTKGWALHVTLSKDNTRAYISDFQDGFTVVDVSVPTNPVTLNSLDTDGEAFGSTLSDNEEVLYVASGSGGVQVFDVRDDNSSYLLNTIMTPYCNALALSSDGKTLFATTSKGIYVYAVNGSALTLLSVFDTSSSYKDITIADNGSRLVVYTASSYTDLINIEDLQQLKRENRYYLDGKFALQKEKNVLFSAVEGKIDDDIVSVSLNSDIIKVMEDFSEETISIAMDSTISSAEVSVQLENGNSIVVGNYNKRYDNSIDKGTFKLPISSIDTEVGLNTLIISVRTGNEISQRTLYVQVFKK